MVRISILVGLVAAQIHILSPGGLIDQFPTTHGNIYGTTATFGTPYYGERVTGRIRYDRPKTNHHHCQADGYDIPDLPGVSGIEEMLRIVMVDRGECTFVTKVRIAQEYKGAHGVIVVDNTEMTPDDIQHIIMADDGWGGGGKVSIPSIMISSGEGEKLKAAVERNEEVIVELAWDIPTSNVVSIDFWMTSGSLEANDFLNNFKPHVDKMKYNVQFTPHFHVFSLPQDLSNLCSDASGKFCAPDPDGTGPITGAMVLAEDLRQLCIWKVTKEPDPKNLASGATFSPKYWNYLERFHSQCSVASGKFGDGCSKAVMTYLALDTVAIQRCTMTEHDQLLQEAHDNVAWSPLALRINGWRYSGPLDPITVLKAACSGFVSAPAQCQEYANIHYSIIKHLDGVAFLHALMVFVCLILGLVCLFYIYKRYLQKTVRAALREEVMLEVTSQMQEYQALDENEQARGRVF